MVEKAQATRKVKVVSQKTLDSKQFIVGANCRHRTKAFERRRVYRQVKRQSEAGISLVSVRSAKAYHYRRDRTKQSSFVARQILTFNYFIFFYNRYEISDIRNSRKKEKYRIFINLLLLA